METGNILRKPYDQRRINDLLSKHGKLRREENARYGVAVENLESVTLGDALVSPGSISLLDPRCVIVGEESGVLYTPRPYMQDFPAEMRAWMEVHTDWPARLELEMQSSH